MLLLLELLLLELFPALDELLLLELFPLPEFVFSLEELLLFELLFNPEELLSGFWFPELLFPPDELLLPLLPDPEFPVLLLLGFELLLLSSFFELFDESSFFEPLEATASVVALESLTSSAVVACSVVLLFSVESFAASVVPASVVIEPASDIVAAVFLLLFLPELLVMLYIASEMSPVAITNTAMIIRIMFLLLFLFI